METKRDIETKARSLIDSSPADAKMLYERIWSEFNDQFNAWDAFNLLKAMRKNITVDSNILNEVIEKFKEEEKVSGLFSWYIFDKYIKQVDKNELIKNENIIRKSFEIAKQKNLSENHEFPCPLTIAVFQLADAHAENLFNARKISDLLDFLNPEFLSSVAKTIQTEKKGEVVLASDREKYYSLKTKALLKLEEYSQCIELCDKALSSFTEFHFNNDLWFKMRKAICYEKLGEPDKGEKLLHEILSTKAGSDKWFLYRDIAELYYEQSDYEKSWLYAVNAAYYGNEPQFMVNLYLLQARILYKLNRKEEGEILANLLAAIIKENDWKEKPEYSKLFKFYNVSLSNLSSVHEYFRKAKEFWSAERYRGKNREKGKIIYVHENGKKGKIKKAPDTILFFSKRDFRKSIRDLKQVLKSNVEYYQMTDFKGDSIAEDIVILDLPKAEKQDSALVGKTFNGKVKSIKEFGIFISIPEMRDGLLHKNSLPKKFQETFKEVFSIGDEIEVEVAEVTQKGVSLRLRK
jgi:hypothetical protein